MPSPQPPLILVDNVFDRINLYPLAHLDGDVAVVGRELSYLADYRRERTYYQTATPRATAFASSDLGVGNTRAVDFCWIDRGHNLWGKTITVSGDDALGGSVLNPAGYVVPALGTVGGDPTTGWCVTEEGALYTLFTLTAARRQWRIYVTEVWAPILPGVIIGNRVQLSSPAGWSSVVDEDAGDRSDRSENSLVPGYDGADRTYSARKVELRLAYIGATEYDATIRYLRRALYEINQPAVVCMNYGTKPERAWLYRYSGKSWSSPTKGSSRSVNIPMTEVGPLIR